MPLIIEPEVVGQIDVVAVALDDSWSRWRGVPGEVIGTWSGDRVRVALGLVASLPEAEQMRCFVPRYGMRMRAESLVLAEVAFCFKCHNAKVFRSDHTPQLPNWFTFDPDSPPAQELLRLFRACSPGSTDPT
jgi:hypothetical protein